MNKVQLIGRLGQKPELSHTPSGIAICRASIATNERWKDDAGNRQERTDWHRIVIWRKLAEIFAEYLDKGDQVYIEGKLHTREYFDQKTGEKKWITDITVTDMEMLGSRKNGGSSSEIPPSQEPAYENNNSQSSPVNGEEDLPF